MRFENSYAAIRQFEKSSFLQVAKYRCGGCARHARHLGQCLLADIEIDRLLCVAVHTEPLPGDVKQDADEAMNVVLVHKIVSQREGPIQMRECHPVELPPRRRVGGRDGVDSLHWQAENFGIARRTGIDPAPSACESRDLSELGTRQHQAAEVRPGLHWRYFQRDRA
jgi:hypothetical protein